MKKIFFLIFLAFSISVFSQSNVLKLDYSNITIPLIYGEFDNDFITINGGLRLNITDVNSSTYTILPSDKIISVSYTSTGAVTITLPTPVNKMSYVIKDSGGNCNANNITIETSGSETIDGNSNYVLNNDYDAISLYSDGSNWYIY